MDFPANALVLNGKVIALLEEGTVTQLLEMATEGKTPGLQCCSLEIPLSRDSFTVDRQQYSHNLAYETPVKKHQAKLTIEFIRRGETELVHT